MQYLREVSTTIGISYEASSCISDPNSEVCLKYMEKIQSKKIHSNLIKLLTPILSYFLSCLIIFAYDKFKARKEVK